jgi:hypothetical protein
MATLDPVVPDTKFAVPPSDALKSQFDQAASNGDVKSMNDLLPTAAGTSLVPSIIQSADVMRRNITPAEVSLQAAKNNGGLSTPQGRIAFADTVSEFKKLQPETGFLKGIANSLMGVPDAWKSMTRGLETSRVEYDKFGKPVIASYAQNNPDTPFQVLDGNTKQPISIKEYGERGVHLFKDAAQSPFVQAEGEVVKKNALEFAKSAERANINAAAYSAIGKNAQKMEQLWDSFSSKYGISNDTLNELYSLSSKTLSHEQAVSDAVNQMLQGMSNESKREGAEKLRSLTGGGGIPAIVSINGKNQYVDSTGNAYSTQDMQQKVNDYLKKNTLNTQYQQNKQALEESATFKILDPEAKVAMREIMNLTQANHMLKNDVATTVGALPIITTDIPHKIGDPFKVGIISTQIAQANAEKVAAFQDFFANESKRFSPSNPPTAGALEAAFTRPDSETLNAINNKYAKRIQEIEARPMPETKQTSLIGASVNGQALPTGEKQTEKKGVAGRSFKNTNAPDHSSMLKSIIERNSK